MDSSSSSSSSSSASFLICIDPSPSSSVDIETFEDEEEEDGEAGEVVEDAKEEFVVVVGFGVGTGLEMIRPRRNCWNPIAESASQKLSLNPISDANFQALTVASEASCFRTSFS